MTSGFTGGEEKWRWWSSFDYNKWNLWTDKYQEGWCDINVTKHELDQLLQGSVHHLFTEGTSGETWEGVEKETNQNWSKMSSLDSQRLVQEGKVVNTYGQESITNYVKYHCL